MIKSSLYSLITKVMVTILNLVLIAILGRILDPKEFGLFAIVLSVQNLLQPIVDMGLTPAFVKVKKPTEDLKNTFFTINVLLGVFNTIILCLISPIVSAIYKINEIKYLIPLFSLSVIIMSVSRQGYAQLVRERSFRKLFKIDMIANLITLVFSVYLANNNFGVWTLVLKAIILNLSITILVHYFEKTHYHMVSLKTMKQFKKELKFGFEVSLNRILNGIFNAIDKFAFGKIYNAELLGHYSNSQQVARMVDLNIRTPITSAVYSHLERYKDNEKKAFYDLFASLVFLITSIASGILILEGDKLIIILLGEKWNYASEYIQILGLFSMSLVLKSIFSIIAMSENSLNFHNKVSLFAILLIISIIITIYLLKLNAILFVMLISIIFFLYWIVFLFIELKKNNNIFKSHFFNVCMYIFIVLISLSFFKKYLLNEILELIIVGLIYIFLILIYILKIFNQTKSNK